MTRKPCLPTTPWSESDDDVLRVMYAQSMPLAEIAFEIGRSTAAVTKRRKRLGLIPNRSRGPKDTTSLSREREHVMDLSGRRHTPEEIALRSGLPLGRVINIMRAAGEPDQSMVANDDALVRKLMADGGMPRYPTHPRTGAIIGCGWFGSDGYRWSGFARLGRAA